MQGMPLTGSSKTQATSHAAGGPEDGLQVAKASLDVPGRQRKGVVVVDAVPLYRSGAVAALEAAGVLVAGEASRATDGVRLARELEAAALVLGGADVAEVARAVSELPGCGVVVLVSQPSRGHLMEMLATGVAGLGPRSLTPEELLSTVKAAAETAGNNLGEGGAGGPAFVPLPLGVEPAAGKGDGAPRGSEAKAVLTPKELEILGLLAKGASNKQIADALYVTQATVKTHLAHIYAKLGARGRHEAISKAFARRFLR